MEQAQIQYKTDSLLIFHNNGSLDNYLCGLLCGSSNGPTSYATECRFRKEGITPQVEAIEGRIPGKTEMIRDVRLAILAYLTDENGVSLLERVFSRVKNPKDVRRIGDHIGEFYSSINGVEEKLERMRKTLEKKCLNPYKRRRDAIRAINREIRRKITED